MCSSGIDRRKDCFLKINEFLLDGFKSFLVLEGKHEDDAIDGLEELER